MKTEEKLPEEVQSREVRKRSIRLKIRKTAIALAAAALCLGGVWGCAGTSRNTDEKTAIETNAKGKDPADGEAKPDEAAGNSAKANAPQTYCFQDVHDNSYEAELLKDVPECIYDFSLLSEKNGFKHYEDAKNGIVSKVGIDVSEFQGEIDWNAVRESGVEFVIVRMGYRGYGESGALVKDSMFDAHVKGAQAAGLQVGAYFFSQAVSAEEAREEAAFVLEHIAPYNLTGPVVFDTEEIKYDTARTDNNTREQFTDYCIVFCEEIQNAGYQAVIYANMKWMAFTLDLTRLTAYPFWYADYHAVPQCPYAYELWQYTETGEVSGVSGNVDINLWFQKTGIDGEE